MPTRKRHLTERHALGTDEALIPPKETASKNRRPLQSIPTAQTDKPRINALATAGKKKKPK